MKLDAQILSRLTGFAATQKGVFTVSDLESLLETADPVRLQIKLRPFLNAGLLMRFCRGFYVTADFVPEILSQRICPDSALSFGTVLAKNLLIGSVPDKTLYAVKIGPTRNYRSDFYRIVHLGYSAAAKSKMSEGYSWQGGIRTADVEKAFLDTLSFYQSGYRFSFNVYSDIDVSRLNRKKIARYLRLYPNPKFKAFVKGVLHG